MPDHRKIRSRPRLLRPQPRISGRPRRRHHSGLHGPHRRLRHRATTTNSIPSPPAITTPSSASSTTPDARNPLAPQPKMCRRLPGPKKKSTTSKRSTRRFHQPPKPATRRHLSRAKPPPTCSRLHGADRRDSIDRRTILETLERTTSRSNPNTITRTSKPGRQPQRPKPETRRRSISRLSSSSKQRKEDHRR